MMCSNASHPLISIIIPCYNHGRYLAQAIESIQRQDYGNIEIIVVDDGSTDNTKEIAATFPGVTYVYQRNAGLSAARNKGIDECKGDYLVFLDADDILYPGAIQHNLDYLKKYPDCAFVSGSHDKVDEWLYPLSQDDPQVSIQKDHYQQLLLGNYIGMHAAVMYQRRIFNEFRFDTSLGACEDYDLYFKIARAYRVGSHERKLAAYRQHGLNMSANILWMLAHVRKVLARQHAVLRDDQERKCMAEGLSIWKKYYGELLHRQLANGMGKDSEWPSVAEIKLLLETVPQKLVSYIIKRFRYNLRTSLKKNLPDSTLKMLHQLGLYRHYTPAPGKVEAGDFDRIKPFSNDFGFDRGGAIDRFYIENFLRENEQHIRGHVLEIGDNEYTIRYGDTKVVQSDILHIDSRNSKATYIGDITDVPQIPTARFDCIIFTQTLHLIYDFKSALNTCYRILKPGGCLLLTVPGISHVDQGEWKEYWLWSFTDNAIKRLMKDTFNGSAVNVKTYGNVYVAAAFLYGMGLPEFRKDFLTKHDPSYQVIISASAIKA